MTNADYKRLGGAARIKPRLRLRKAPAPFILRRVNRLTRQEMLFIVTVAGLLLTGLLVKFYRESHPPAATQTDHARD